MNQLLQRKMIVLGVLISCSGWLFGQGAYIYVKAKLAQYLIHESWEQSLALGKDIKPWPWADTWPVARIIASKYNVDLIVLAGSSGRTLAFGPGHQDGSASPGYVGNSIISAHRDTHFQFLSRLQSGDELLVQNRSGEIKTFRVVERQIINSQRVSLSAEYPRPLLSLVTCYPFNAIRPGGPLRYIVFAEEVGAIFI
jgi:sortase A